MRTSTGVGRSQPWGIPLRGQGGTLPIALFDSPCSFRETIAALDRAGTPWRSTFTSPSLPGLWAAVEAGLGITLRTTIGLPDSLVVLDEGSGLPPLPSIELSLHGAGRELTPAIVQLKKILLEILAENLTAIPRAEIVHSKPSHCPPDQSFSTTSK
jgi:DNA-binding transcriptional LysR family regulator